MRLESRRFRVWANAQGNESSSPIGRAAAREGGAGLEVNPTEDEWSRSCEPAREAEPRGWQDFRRAALVLNSEALAPIRKLRQVLRPA